jgi:DNA-binding protein HU-beta
MVKVGDVVETATRKIGQTPRTGTVTAISGMLITVRWESGEQTSLIPASGSLAVVGTGRSDIGAARASGPRAPSVMPRTARTIGRSATRAAAPRKEPAKKALAKKAPAKKAPLKKTTSKNTSAKSAPAKKAPLKKTTSKNTSAKKAPVKKASPLKKTGAKKTAAKKPPRGGQR